MIYEPNDIAKASKETKQRVFSDSNGSRQPYYFKENIFTKEECDKIWSYWKNEDVFIEIVNNEESPWYKYFREKRSRKHMFLENEIDWLDAKLDKIVLMANRDCFHLDISYGCLSKQLMQYDIDDWFDTHDDTNHWDNHHHDRKLTFIIQLSNEEDYDGGETIVEEHLNIAQPNNVKLQGSVLLFPTFAIHKVNKITAGTRRAFICWYGGPKFR